MKRLTVICMIGVWAGIASAQKLAETAEMAGTAAAKPVASDEAALMASASTSVPSVPSTAMLGNPLMSNAVAATLREEKTAGSAAFGRDHAPAYAHNPAVDTPPPPNKYQAFAIAFDEAKLPDCLHADGLKYQPLPPLVPAQFLLPFIVVAKLRGVCN
jgi:hypothetical protein